MYYAGPAFWLVNVRKYEGHPDNFRFWKECLMTGISPDWSRLIEEI